MQTKQLNIELMNDNQANKELIFNEAMIKLDSLSNIAINDFAYEKDISDDQNYILLDEENKNKISFKNINSDKRQHFIPNNIFIVFVLKKEKFYIFDSKNWNEINYDVKTNIEQQQGNFLEINEFFSIGKDSPEYIYLYVASDIEIKIDNCPLKEFNLIIKQTQNEAYDINWSHNILWPGRENFNVSKIPNSISMIKFLKLENENFYLAISCNHYEY